MSSFKANTERLINGYTTRRDNLRGLKEGKEQEARRLAEQRRKAIQFHLITLLPNLDAYTIAKLRKAVPTFFGRAVESHLGQVSNIEVPLSCYLIGWMAGNGPENYRKERREEIFTQLQAQLSAHLLQLNPTPAFMADVDDYNTKIVAAQKEIEGLGRGIGQCEEQIKRLRSNLRMFEQHGAARIPRNVSDAIAEQARRDREREAQERLTGNRRDDRRRYDSDDDYYPTGRTDTVFVPVPIIVDQPREVHHHHHESERHSGNGFDRSTSRRHEEVERGGSISPVIAAQEEDRGGSFSVQAESDHEEDRGGSMTINVSAEASVGSMS